MIFFYPRILFCYNYLHLCNAFIERIFDFYIYSNIHVALAGFCLTKVTLLKFGLEGWNTSFFVALSVIISYNFINYYETKKTTHNWFKSWFFAHKNELLTLTGLSILALVYVVFYTKFEQSAVILLIPFALMTFFYVIPMARYGEIEISFRNFPSLKIFSIAIVWAGVSVFFPLYEANYSIGIDVYIEFVQRVLLLIAITLPFDIRDVYSDSKLLKTLPQVFGLKTTKLVGFLLLIEFVLLELFKYNFSINELFVLIIISVIAGLFLWFSSPRMTRYYTSFCVEAVPIIWFGLYVLF